jgi:hypothetical protein
VNGKLLLEAFFAQAHTYLVASRSGY